MITACWLYFLVKFLDLFETFFLVVDKRSNEISNTCLLYEGFVLLSGNYFDDCYVLEIFTRDFFFSPFCAAWFIVRFIPGGHVSVLMLVDTSVHVLKHLFYLVTQKKPIAGSKILLALHLIQSIIIFIHVVELLTWNYCNFPTPFIGLLSIQSVLLFLLFRSKCKRSEYNSVVRISFKGTFKYCIRYSSKLHQFSIINLHKNRNIICIL